MPLALNSTQFGEKSAPKLILLHGLMGSSRNWLMVAKALSTKFNVHVLDLRNHGQSPWSETMDWSELSADLKGYCDRACKDESIYLLGHSLGGKCAMHFATHFPERVEKLVVVDIVAKPYPPHFKKEFEALLSLPVASLESRQEGLALLEEAIPDRLFRESLLANLRRIPSGLNPNPNPNPNLGFVWQPNIAVLYAHLETIRTNPLNTGDAFSNQTLLIKGGQSNFIELSDLPNMEVYFPKLDFVCLERAGHNPHIDSKEEFVRILLNWL
jgi:esterase